MNSVKALIQQAVKTSPSYWLFCRLALDIAAKYLYQDQS